MQTKRKQKIQTNKIYTLFLIRSQSIFFQISGMNHGNIELKRMRFPPCYVSALDIHIGQFSITHEILRNKRYCFEILKQFMVYFNDPL